MSSTTSEATAGVTVTCPYCGKPARFFQSSERFYNGRDYGPLWACVPCGAWVGCHKGTVTPLGRLADKALRAAKIRVHNAFDPLWRSGMMSRSAAYGYLAMQLDLTPSACHIGYFDIETCDRVVQICKGLADRPRDPPASVQRHLERHQRSNTR
jgi:hypothetical protein